MVGFLKKKKWLLLPVIALLIVGVVLAGYGLKRYDTRCGLELYYPSGSAEKRFVPCGFIEKSSDGSLAYLLGKVERMERVGGKAYMDLNLGRKKEMVVLGGVAKKVSIMVTDSENLPFSGYLKMSPELKNLDEAGFDDVKNNIMGKIVIIVISTGTADSIKESLQRLSELKRDNKQEMESAIYKLGKCNQYFEAKFGYYDEKNGMNAWARGWQNINTMINTQKCEIETGNIYVY